VFQVTPLGTKYYGRYTCRAVNPHGSAEHVIVLKEARPPSEVLQTKLESVTGNNFVVHNMAVK